MSHIISNRRHDLDALRVLACYLLLLFHVGMVFNPAPFYHVRNDEVSFAFLVLCGFIGIWHMPLFFLLAGWSAAASFGRRGAAGFLRERGSKLVVPLLAGCILLAPAIKYLELRSGFDLNHRGLFVSQPLQESFRAELGLELPLSGRFDESFAEFLPTFFTELDRFSWSHLWFLAYLLCLSLALLPLFVRLLGRSDPTRGLSHRWIHAPLLPLILIQLVLRPHFPGPYNLYHDWANLSFFATFLIAGFLLALHPELETGIRSSRWRFLGAALGSMCVLLASVVGLVEWPPLLLAGSAIASWYSVLAILGFAREHVKEGGARLEYLSESAFPVYLLHQPIVVGLAFVVVGWPLGIGSKFVLLLAAATASTLAVHHFVLRRSGPLRLLAGIKPRAAAGPAPAAPQGAANALGRS